MIGADAGNGLLIERKDKSSFIKLFPEQAANATLAKMCFPSAGLIQNSIDSGYCGWTTCRQMELTASWAKLQDTGSIDRRMHDQVAYAQGSADG